MSKRPINLFIYAALTLFVFLLIAIPFIPRPEKSGESIIYRKLLMGTIVEITIFDGDPERYDRAAKLAFREIKRLEGIFSSYIPLSDVSRVSSASGGGPVGVSAEVIEVARIALRVAELTGGAFDPTIGSLAGLWGYSGESGEVPSKEALEKALPLVDYRSIVVDEEASTVALKRPGTAFNLGGIAKGYIVGRSVDVLKANGVRRAIIKAGGDMFAFRTPGVDAPPFRIGVRHPRDAEKLLAEVDLTEGAVATSGDYERFFEKDGVRYHHILDPGTGFPANRSRSVTIVSADPTLADALSTGVFVMGPDKGLELVESLEGVEALIVDSEGLILRSSGFSGKVY